MRSLSPAVIIATGLWYTVLTAEEEPSRWDSFYVEGAAGAGRSTALGGVSLFGPLYTTEEGFLYTDLRGIWGDDLDAVQSYGFGGRFQDTHELIRGIYVFYDRQRSTSDTTHQQLTIGTELLGLEWDFRINAYLPDRKMTQSGSVGTMDDERIVVSGLTETSYYGADTEFGYLLNEWRDGQIELRGYIGAYWFDRNHDGFDAFVGPRARAELRLFDLDWLGPGSRLVAAGQADWNRRDKTQLTGLLTLRVPLQFRKGKPLSRLDRRMLNPVARWPGAFLNTLWTVESAAFADGRPISETLRIDANTPDPETAVQELPVNSLVIIDGSEGEIELRSTLQMREGQTLVGGEGFFEVVGRVTGGRGFFVAPGVRPIIVQTDSNAAAIQLPGRNGQVLGLNVFSMNHGIVGGGTTNTTIAGNALSGNSSGRTAHGVWLEGDQHNLTILANIITNKDNGIRLLGDVHGEIADNAVARNSMSGINIIGNLHADVVNNLIMENGQRGLVVQKGDLVGDVKDNYFGDNALDGLYVVGDVRGDIADNVAEEHRFAGFVVEGAVRGDVTGNESRRNGEGGFVFQGIVDGDVRGNLAFNNGQDGMRFVSTITGDVAGNELSENGYLGLFAGDGVRGSIRDNVIRENGFHYRAANQQAGLRIIGTMGGPMEGNTFFGNRGFGADLQLEGPQTVSFERNELSGNNQFRGDLFVGPVGGSSVPIVVHLKDNSSDDAASTYPFKTYQRATGVEFIDDGGNEGRID